MYLGISVHYRQIKNTQLAINYHSQKYAMILK